MSADDDAFKAIFLQRMTEHFMSRGQDEETASENAELLLKLADKLSEQFAPKDSG